MDVELTFSRNPFQGRKESRLSVIEPNLKKTLELEPKATWERIEWKVPEELKNRNMILEVVSGGIVRSVPLYSNSLNVNLSVPLGRLQVLSSDNKKPIEGAYVKVYARHSDGSVRFYKDAYTDLRDDGLCLVKHAGWFDGHEILDLGTASGVRGVDPGVRAAGIKPTEA